MTLSWHTLITTSGKKCRINVNLTGEVCSNAPSQSMAPGQCRTIGIQSKTPRSGERILWFIETFRVNRAKLLSRRCVSFLRRRVSNRRSMNPILIQNHEKDPKVRHGRLGSDRIDGESRIQLERSRGLFTGIGHSDPLHI